MEKTFQTIIQTKNDSVIHVEGGGARSGEAK